MVNEPVFPGEVVLSRSPGGGGWGDSLDRDPRRVWDVIDGLVARSGPTTYTAWLWDPKAARQTRWNWTLLLRNDCGRNAERRPPARTRPKRGVEGRDDDGRDNGRRSRCYDYC